MSMYYWKPRLRDYADQPQCWKKDKRDAYLNEKEENRAILIALTLAIVVFLSIAAHCGELPNAPEPQTAPVFTRTNVLLFSANAGLRITDAVATCQDFGRPLHHELTLPFQSCAGVAAWNLAMIPAQVGTVALLQHWHHNKLARVAAVAFPMVDVPSVIWTLTHEHALHAPVVPFVPNMVNR